MIVKNRYYYRSRIKEVKFRQIIRYFALDYTATTTAQLVQMSIRSVNSIYLKVRQRIAQFCEQESPLKETTEVHQSFPDALQTRDIKICDNYGKTIVFGILKQSNKVFTELVPAYSKTTLQGVIHGLIAPDTVIHAEGWRGYDGLVDVGFGKYFLIQYGNNQIADAESQSDNKIESFWRFAKRRLTKFNGVPEHTFYLHLKETEFRFNHQRGNLYYAILKILRLNPL
ncbi:MAG: IS1595 family transposase [Nitrosomonas sp.]|jgi:transposase|nr:IS1595 family transposase [Nitrosomonas sp.]MBP7111883.1 IS1595 family transposase [Nitrosomonas sp.]